MPSSPKRICRFAQCQIKTKDTYCDEHKGMEKAYSGTTTDPWYNKTTWRGTRPYMPLGKRGGLRESQIVRVPYCEECNRNGIIKEVTGKGEAHVDHIVPFRSVPETEQWQYFIDPNNHQTLCADCHSRKMGAS